MKIKICGITREKETEMLNDLGVDYAGFVIYEKSKRRVTVERAAELKEKLDKSIKSVAVTVSPDTGLLKEIQDAGFDIIQIHKNLDEQVLKEAKIPIWLALNISSAGEAKKELEGLKTRCGDDEKKIEAIVMDAPDFGSGKTFDWEDAKAGKDGKDNSGRIADGKLLVLAGGLNESNVAEGIRIFRPDIVDVSSSVEGDDGKDPEKAGAFTGAVRNADVVNKEVSEDRQETEVMR